MSGRDSGGSGYGRQGVHSGESLLPPRDYPKLFAGKRPQHHQELVLRSYHKDPIPIMLGSKPPSPNPRIQDIYYYFFDSEGLLKRSCWIPDESGQFAEDKKFAIVVRPPPTKESDTLIVLTDGSFDENTNKAKYGFSVIENVTFKVLYTVSKRSSQPTNSTYHEVESLSMAAKFCKDVLGRFRVEFFNDCEDAISLIMSGKGISNQQRRKFGDPCCNLADTTRTYLKANFSTGRKWKSTDPLFFYIHQCAREAMFMADHLSKAPDVEGREDEEEIRYGSTTAPGGTSTLSATTIYFEEKRILDLGGIRYTGDKRTKKSWW